MSRDGSGNYTLPAGNPVVTGTTISSTVQNNTMNDVAAALTASIASDGQTTPTADLKMGGFKHKNVANAASRISTNSNYASAADVQDGTYTYLTGVSGTNTITASAPLGLAAYVTGQRFVFVPAVINTGATTLNINSIGAKNVFLNGAALVAGELQLVPVEVEYDGTQFNILANSSYSSGIPGKQGADVASAGTVNLDTVTGDLIDVTGVTTITAITLSQGRQRIVRFTGALILTNGASLVLPGAANITTAAGDFAIFAGYAAGVVRCIGYTKAAAGVLPPGFGMAPITNSLGADVALNNTANYFDGPSVAQGTVGTWFVSGTVTVQDTAIADHFFKLWDGTTVIASASARSPAINIACTVSLSGFITAPAGNLRISVKDLTSVNGTIKANVSANGKDSTITAFRIA